MYCQEKKYLLFSKSNKIEVVNRQPQDIYTIFCLYSLIKRTTGNLIEMDRYRNLATEHNWKMDDCYITKVRKESVIDMI